MDSLCGVEMDGGGDDGLSPIGGAGKVGGGGDFSALHFQNQQRARAFAFGGIGLCGIVKNTQVVDEGQEANEIFATSIPALADFFFRDVVPTVRHATAHAADVEVGTGQSAEPNVQAVTGAGSLFEQLRDAAPAKCGFKPVVASTGNGLLKKGLADLPCVGVGRRDGNVGLLVADLLGDGIGIENGGVFKIELGLPDT